MIDPVVILVVGMVIVVGGVLALRLHAFLALLLAAVAVAALTTTDQIVGARVSASSVAVIAVEPDNQWLVEPGKGRSLIAGKNYLIVDGKLTEQTVMLTIVGKDTVQPRLTRVQIQGATEKLDPAHLGLLHETVRSSAIKDGNAGVGDRVASGLGKTATSIGIIIALAAIIGECLMLSGAADRIVWSIRRLLGDQRAPQGFVFSGFVLGIPVFFDTVFYLLLPLAKALRRRTGRNWVLYVLSVVAGATMAHSLVPPTPGPLMAANELGVSMGLMMIGGTIVGLIAASVGFVYATWANRRWDVPPPADDTAVEVAEPDLKTLPPLWLALAPILLPVVLISAAASLDLFPADTAMPWWAQQIQFWGDKNISLGVSAMLALITYWHFKRVSFKQLNATTQTALASAGVIILITSAGGAFGAVLQQTGIADVLTAMMPASKAALLPIAFLITATIRIAQGSATVAMITAVGIVAPLVAAGDLGFHPLYVALAIGCGSKPIPWMNDSGFWIIGKMSGFSELQTLRTASVMMSLMGVVGLIVTMLGAWLLPLV
jgi:GntP family gluconate:H+ symporter